MPKATCTLLLNGELKDFLFVLRSLCQSGKGPEFLDLIRTWRNFKLLQTSGSRLFFFEPFQSCWLLMGSATVMRATFGGSSTLVP